MTFSLKKALILHNDVTLLSQFLTATTATTVITIKHFQKNVCINELRNNDNKIFVSIVMLKFGQTKVSKGEFHGAIKPIKTQLVNVNNIVISKLIETKNDFKYLIGYLDQVIRPLVLIAHNGQIC